MKEQEKEIKRVISYIRSCRDAGTDTTITIDKSRSHFVLNALEEIQQYRAIGTVEKCREAMEKQRAKKPKTILRHRGGFEVEHCPNCDTNYQVDRRYIINDDYCPLCGKLLDSGFKNFCPNCGQAVERSEEDE